MKSSTNLPYDARLQIRCPQQLLDEIDKWRAKQWPLLNRSQAVIALIERGVANDLPVRGDISPP
jgi:hypothetical protein